MAKIKKAKAVKMPYHKMLAGAKAKDVFVVTDPEDADRVLEVLDKKYEFKHGSLEKVLVTAEEAKALSASYPYLVVEKV